MSKGYDTKCYDLAKVFLSDEPALDALDNEPNRDDLAQSIQDAIENTIESMRDNSKASFPGSIEYVDPAETAPSPPSVDGLEAQCRKFVLENTHWNPTYENAAIVTKLVAFIRTRDRELVESIEGAMLSGAPMHVLLDELRAVLAAWNEGGRSDK